MEIELPTRKGIKKVKSIQATLDKLTNLKKLTINIRNTDLSNPEPGDHGELLESNHTVTKFVLRHKKVDSDVSNFNYYIDCLSFERTEDSQMSSKCSKIIGPLKIPLGFQLVFLAISSENHLSNDYSLLYLTSGLSRNKSLKSVSFQLNRSFIAEKGLAEIGNGLKSLKQLKKLKLNLGTCAKVTSKAASDLMNSLNANLKLKHLTLDFPFCSEISEGLFVPLSNLLEKLTDLKYLSLDFLKLNVSDKDFKNLAQVISLRKHLTHFAINFSWCNQIKNDELSSLIKSITNLPELESLSLIFSFCSQFSKETLSYLSAALQQFPKLRSLTLVLSDSEVSENWLSVFGFMLSSIPLLTNLSIDLTSCKKLTDDGILNLTNHFIRLKQLRTFSLDVSGTNISDKGLYYLMRNMRYNKSLETFKFAAKFTPITLEKFNKTALYFTRVQKIKIDLCRTSVSDKGILSLNEGLRFLKQLKVLSINFETTNTFTDLGISKLADSFQDLRNLIKLKINLKICAILTDKSMEYIALKLPELRKLRKFSIALTGIDTITNKTVQDFGNQILSHPTLEEVDLDYCLTKTNDLSLKPYKRLRHASLALYGLELTTKTKQEFNIYEYYNHFRRSIDIKRVNI